MKLTEFVVSEAVLPDLQVSTKEDAIRSMVGSLTKTGAIAADQEEAVVSAIMEREELGSTGIGNGVAVPHTKHSAVEQLVSTVALVKNGVDFASLDGEDVYILFLLVSPPDRPGDHLRALETVSKHLRNQNFCSFLRQSDSAKDIIELLSEADSNQLGD